MNRFLLGIVLAMIALSASATELHWTGATDGHWANAANWNPATVPQTGDDLKFDSGANPNTLNDLPPGTTLQSLFFFTFPATAFTVAGNSVQVSLQIHGGNDQVTFNTLVRAAGNLNIMGHPHFAGGFDVNGATVDVNAAQFSGAVSGAGTLRVMTAEFGAVNPFSGTVQITQGFALVNGSLASAAITTASQGKLYGTGATGPVSGSGIISPQPTDFTGPGILTTGSLSLTAIPEPILAGYYRVDISGPAPGSGYDQIKVNGTVTLNNYLIDVNSTYTPAPGTTFVIIDNDGGDPVSGSFTEGSIVTGTNGVQFRVSYHGGDGNDVTLTVLQSATVALTSTPNPSRTGQIVHLVATVSGSAGTPTGSVTFRRSGSALGTASVDGSGQASLDYAFDYYPAGFLLDALDNGDSTYASKASPAITQQVNKADTVTTLSLAPNPVLVGQSFTATVSTTAVSPGAGKPIGTIEIDVDGNYYAQYNTAGLSGTTYNFPLFNVLSAGDHVVTASFTEDNTVPGYNGSAAAPATLQVRNGTAVIASAAPVFPGQPVVVHANVSAVAPATGTPSGTVTVSEGPTTLGTATLDGSGNATVNVAPLSPGTHTLTVSYGGNATYTSSATTVSASVRLLTVDANDVAVSEGSTSHTIQIPVHLNAAADQPVSVHYATADGSAVAGVDYQSASGTLTFAPGETTRAFDVIILGDALPERDKSFDVMLGDVSGAQIGTSRITVTITNDDPFYITLSGLEYAKVNGLSLTLELLLPTTVDGPFPVIVALETDDWAQPPMSSETAAREASRGYAVATVSFRPSSTAKFPAQMDDLRAAVRWLRANAAPYNLDPNRFGAWGIGAGGHLATLLGTGADALQNPSADNASFSSRVQAVVDWYGQTDFRQLNAGSCVDHNAPESAESRLLGCAPSVCGTELQSANPIVYASADDPPFLIMHGTADCFVPAAQSQLLYDALHAAGAPATLRWVNGGHGGAAWSAADVLQAVDQFFDASLKRSAASRRRPVGH